MQHGDVDILPDHRVAAELGAFCLHLFETSVDVTLLHLELGNPVAQQPTDSIGALQHDDLVTGTRELLGGGEAGGTGTDHDDTLTCSDGWHHRHNPALVERPVDDFDFDLFDRYRRLVDSQHTRRFARSRAQPTGELGEVVGCVESVDGVLPVTPIDEIVPVGNQVAERTAVIAERNSTIHAAPCLVRQLVGRKVFVDLFPVAQSHRHRPILR